MAKTKKTTAPVSAHRLWSGEKLYFKGDDYFRDVLNAIRRARRQVDFEVYIFDQGVLGKRVVSALVQAAKRGIQVRLLVDGIGSPHCASEYGPRLEKGGVQFRVYRRFPPFFSLFSRLFGSLFSGKTAHRMRSFWFRVKRRNHRKLVIVDETQVWLGGFNVSDLHLESLNGLKACRDTGLGLSGVRDQAFRLAFQTAWHDRYHRRQWKLFRAQLIEWLVRKTSLNHVQINATRKLRSYFHREMLKRLGKVRRRIWVTTPYFVPTLPLYRALIQAALRGMDVRLVLPEESDVPFVRWASMTFFLPLLEAGCRIFEYRKRVLHAKTLVVDDWALVGSSNFNHRSFLFDLEVDVALQGAASRKALERQYASDFNQSLEIHVSDLKIRPRSIRILSWLFFRLRHWI